MPLKEQNVDGGADRGLHPKINDKIISILQQQINDQLPSTEIAHGLNEPKNSDTDSTLVTKTISVRMPHPSVSDGDDAIDCAIVAQKENRNDLTPALSDSSTVRDNNKQSTPTPAYQKDGHYFLTLLKSEQTRLLTMAEQAERDMFALTTNVNVEISDEIFGILRSVSGKTKLLVSQKLKQFEGLCHSNLNPTSDEKFPTTIGDLQGFWDMINLQIEHVDSLFKELELIKANNWQTTKDLTAPFIPTGSKLMKRPALKYGSANNNRPPSTIKLSPNALLMAQKREAQRKQLMELKRKNKNSTADGGTISSPIEIFVSENFI